MKYGFIGSGNMSEAIIAGMIKSGKYNSKDINVSSRNMNTLLNFKTRYNINDLSSNKELAKLSDIIIIAVKPNMYDIVLKEIKDEITDEKVIVNIAAGKNISDIKKHFDKNIKVIRVMPNTPALVNEAMSVIFPDDYSDKEDILIVEDIFNSLGKTEILDESLIHAVIGVSGSSPAYVYMFIEALADAGVTEGLSRDTAYKLAAQAVLGSAKMVLDTNIHPGNLKDNVSSPGGTTIKAVSSLEQTGFRGSIIKAVDECIKKSKSM